MTDLSNEQQPLLEPESSMLADVAEEAAQLRWWHDRLGAVARLLLDLQHAIDGIGTRPRAAQ